MSLFLGEISHPHDFFKTPCDKHKGLFWGGGGKRHHAIEEMVFEFSIFR
jgi:hypothetical protein